MKLAQQPIVDALRASGARNVEGVIEFARQVEAPRALPAYFVVPLRESASPNAYATARDQRVEASWGIAVVVAGDGRRREQVAEDLQAACTLATRALIGWTHPAAAGPTDYAGGELISTAGGVVTWLLRFAAHYHERRPT